MPAFKILFTQHNFAHIMWDRGQASEMIETPLFSTYGTADVRSSQIGGSRHQRVTKKATPQKASSSTNTIIAI